MELPKIDPGFKLIYKIHNIDEYKKITNHLKSKGIIPTYLLKKCASYGLTAFNKLQNNVKYIIYIPFHGSYSKSYVNMPHKNYLWHLTYSINEFYIKVNILLNKNTTTPIPNLKII